MKGSVAVRGRTQVPIINDNTGTTITVASYVQLSASLPASCSAIEVQNTSAKVIKLAIGAAASEVDQYAVAPGVNTVLVPMEWKKGARLSAKAVGADATTGALVINFLG